MNKEIIICVGISGSGKSTWTTNFLKENHNYLRINRDDIRKTLVGNLDGYYQRQDLNQIEKTVTFLEKSIFNICCRKNNLIIDNTNLKQSYINDWIQYIENTNFMHKYTTIKTIDFKFKLFDCDLLLAKQRVYEREGFGLALDENHITICPETDYINKQYEDYLKIKEWINQTYPNHILD